MTTFLSPRRTRMRSSRGQATRWPPAPQRSRPFCEVAGNPRTCRESYSGGQIPTGSSRDELPRDPSRNLTICSGASGSVGHALRSGLQPRLNRRSRVIASCPGAALYVSVSLRRASPGSSICTTRLTASPCQFWRAARYLAISRRALAVTVTATVSDRAACRVTTSNGGWPAPGR